MYPDGSLVKGPKALCELQGYVYNAWVRMAEALLGFQPDAPRNKRYVDPSLPARLLDLTVRDLRIGKHKLDIRFWTEGEQTAFEVKGPRRGRALRHRDQGRAAEGSFRFDPADERNRGRGR
jgi:hypothetical protein